MDKLTMAHDYAVAMLETPAQLTGMSDKDIAIAAFNLAEAMQAEADKREPSGFPNVLRGACGEIVAVKVDDKEWQPDWSQAPGDALTWAINSDGYASWALYKDGHYFSTVQAPSFNYQGNWQDSLRKRPQ